MKENEIRYLAVDQNESIIISTLSEFEADIAKTITAQSMMVDEYRWGLISKNELNIYACSNSIKYVKSSKLFKKELVAIADLIFSLGIDIQQYKDQLNRSTKRILHNIVSLNGKNIQEIHSIVPQELLSGAIKEHISIIEESISENIRDAAISTLRVAKNNTAIKVEIAVFNKLLDQNPVLTKQPHVVHKVFTNVYYMFSSDFTDKGVHVDIVDMTENKAYFDYESIQVVLYHLLENAVKYIKPKSTFSVSFSEGIDDITITLDMISVRIEEVEKNRIFEEGFSGNIPKKLGRSGDGLGLFISRRLLILNMADLKVESDDRNHEEVMGVPYDRNRFIVDVPKAQKKV